MYSYGAAGLFCLVLQVSFVWCRRSYFLLYSILLCTHIFFFAGSQGVGDTWTDPQIHSWNQEGYGKGNMGQVKAAGCGVRGIEGSKRAGGVVHCRVGSAVGFVVGCGVRQGLAHGRESRRPAQCGSVAAARALLRHAPFLFLSSLSPLFLLSFSSLSRCCATRFAPQLLLLLRRSLGLMRSARRTWRAGGDDQ